MGPRSYGSPCAACKAVSSVSRAEPSFRSRKRLSFWWQRQLLSRDSSVPLQLILRGTGEMPWKAFGFRQPFGLFSLCSGKQSSCWSLCSAGNSLDLAGAWLCTSAALVSPCPGWLTQERRSQPQRSVPRVRTCPSMLLSLYTERKSKWAFYLPLWLICLQYRSPPSLKAPGLGITVDMTRHAV